MLFKKPTCIKKERIALCLLSPECEALCSAKAQNSESSDLGLTFGSLLQLSEINQIHISLTFLFCKLCIIPLSTLSLSLS